MITKIVTFTLKPEFNLADPSSEASKVLSTYLKFEVAAPGCHWGYYGQSMEKPEQGFIFAGWDSLEEYGKFAGTE